MVCTNVLLSSDLVHWDDMGSHEFGSINQAICPAHLNYITLRWRAKLLTVPVLGNKDKHFFRHKTSLHSITESHYLGSYHYILREQVVAK